MDMTSTFLPAYGALPCGGPEASRIFFGTANAPMLAGQDTTALLDEMRGLGINAFDTARGYGLAERVLGNWMALRGNREELIVLSKCGDLKNGVVHLDGPVIEEELAQSLKELRSDYIDVYLLHRDDPNTPIPEYMETLNRAFEAGKIRCFGVSNWTVERIQEANAYAEAHGLQGFSVSSPHYSLAEQVRDPWGGNCITVAGASHETDREWYTQQRMPVIAYSTLSRGFFSGKFKAGDMEGAKLALDPPAQKGYLCQSNMERLARAEVLAQRDGCTVADINMRYIFATKMNFFAVCATGSADRMRQNIAASRNPLRAEDVAFLENGATE